MFSKIVEWFNAKKCQWWTRLTVDEAAVVVSLKSARYYFWSRQVESTHRFVFIVHFACTFPLANMGDATNDLISISG